MKLVHVSTLSLLTLVFACVANAQSELYISALMDGTLNGGTPKAVKICANADITDLSSYGLGSANNGQGSAGEEFTFSGSLSAGECRWIASEAIGFTTFFGCPPDTVSDALNINGNDAIELYKNGVIIDIYGQADVNGSGTCWEHTDGYAVRIGSSPNGGFFDPLCTDGDWTYSGIGGLTNVPNYVALLPAQPFGPFDINCDTNSMALTYYSDIDTTLYCEAFKTALHDLISISSSLPYGPSGSYDVIDFMCQADFVSGQIIDRYANTNYTSCLGDRYTSSSNPNSVGQGWNREHIFPTSWWGGSSALAAYTDLHNLFPADAYTNALKSNLPLGKTVSGASSSSTIGVDINSCATGCNNNVFEPADQYKGDFARAQLYMSVRYEDELPGWASLNCTGDGVLGPDGFESCYLNQLLLWHQNDPVDAIEMARNEAIEVAQGNRNPFIDQPQWAEQIWGLSDGNQLISSPCDEGGCAVPQWEVVEVSPNSSFNNAGQWTPSGSGFTCNSYCGPGCAEYAESWLIYGPLDMTQTTVMELTFTAEEDYGSTTLDFLWTASYSGCPSESANNWMIIGQLDESLIAFENTPQSILADFSSAQGADVYVGIKYADDGADGMNYWRLDNFEINADICPGLGSAMVSSCPSCAGDINGDGLINVNDFLALNTAFGTNCSACPEDINFDGLVDVNDFLDFNTYFGTACP